MSRQELIKNEFKKFKIRSNRNDGRSTKSVRVKSFPVDHLCENLERYYPVINDLRSGEKVNFLIFLLERSLKSKDDEYVYSWDRKYAMNKKDHYKTNDILGS